MGLNEFFNGKNPIKVGSPFTPMGEFPLAKAHDVIVDYDETTKTETRLDEKLASIGNGAPGVGIEFIEKTKTEGLVDTYTITLTNGQEYEFTVTNGASGGGGFVDVDNLPDDNISDQVIYRVIEKEFVNIYIKDEDFSGTFRECLEENGIINCKVLARIVSSLPAGLIKSDISNDGVANIYVVKSTGIAYLNPGDGVVTLGNYWFDSDSFDNGWTNDIQGESSVGAYSIYELKSRYYIYKNGLWVQLADSSDVEKAMNDAISEATKGIIDVQFELPVVNINENMIYRLTYVKSEVFVIKDGETMTAEEYFHGQNHLNAKVDVTVVDTVPETIERLDFSGTVYLCVVKTNGIVYCNGGYGVVTLGSYLYGVDHMDKGLLLKNSTLDGIYCGSSYSYYACKDGEWKKFVTDIEENKVVQTVPTPEEMDEIIDNATPEDEGNTYIYVGVTNEKYRYGGFYRITREIKVDE